jgi:tetratricopeptide (TPR) repeat protein
VAGAFALSYAHLAPDSQRLFRLLGLHPGEHFDACAAAALVDMRLLEAQRLLDELLDGHLIEELHARRYRLHDLVRDYAAELTRTADPGPDRAAAIRNLLDYYLHAAAAAGEHLEAPSSRCNFQPGQPARPDLVQRDRRLDATWLEEERSNLTAAVRHALDISEDRYAWLLARATWRYFFLRGYVDDLVETHQRGLLAADRLGDIDAVATVRNYLAAAYYRIGHYRTAIGHLQHTLKRCQVTGEKEREAIIRLQVAFLHAHLGRMEEADQDCQAALVVGRQDRSTERLVILLVNAGAVYLAMGRYSDALRYSRLGLALLRETGGAVGSAATVLGNLGAIRARLGQPEIALRILHAALRLERRRGYRFGEGEVLTNIGSVCRLLRRFEEAIAYHREALVLMREGGDRAGECTVFNDLARTLCATGDTATALDLHRRALAIATKIQLKYEHARALDGIAHCLRDTDPESARRHWQQAYQLYEEMGVTERYDVAQQLGTPQ